MLQSNIHFAYGFARIDIFKFTWNNFIGNMIYIPLYHAGLCSQIIYLMQEMQHFLGTGNTLALPPTILQTPSRASSTSSWGHMPSMDNFTGGFCQYLCQY